jgi:hypothetical protein
MKPAFLLVIFSVFFGNRAIDAGEMMVKIVGYKWKRPFSCDIFSTVKEENI